MKQVLRNIIVIVAILTFFMFGIGFVVPRPTEPFRNLKPLQVVLVNKNGQSEKDFKSIRDSIPDKNEITTPEQKYYENNAANQYRLSPEPPAKLSVNTNTSTYYKCIKTDGSTSYQATPCGIGEKENRKFLVEETSRRIDLHPEPNGNYVVSGSVNGHAVKFQVDTGASTVVLSTIEAAAYGVTGCIRGISSTANGIINTCVATASTITFGGFSLNNVVVTILPNSTTPLLGMNVLKQFNMEQTNGLMRISKQ